MSLRLPKCLELNFRGFSHLKTENFSGGGPPDPHIKTTSTPNPATPLRRERTPRTCHRLAPSCFFIFLPAKTNHFPANGSCDSALGRCRAHDACATATIMAPSLRQTMHCRSHVRLLPPFFYGWLRTVRFQRPLILHCVHEVHVCSEKAMV